MTRDELWQWALQQAESAPPLTDEVREQLRPLLQPVVEMRRSA